MIHLTRYPIARRKPRLNLILSAKYSEITFSRKGMASTYNAEVVAERLPGLSGLAAPTLGFP